jgi:hypothetical protein
MIIVLVVFEIKIFLLIYYENEIYVITFSASLKSLSPCVPLSARRRRGGFRG